jgi:hypothetical protein
MDIKLYNVFTYIKIMDQKVFTKSEKEQYDVFAELLNISAKIFFISFVSFPMISRLDLKCIDEFNTAGITS